MAITSGLRFGVQLVAGAALAAGLGLGGYFIYQAVSDPVAQKLPIMPVSKMVPDAASKSVSEPLQTPDTASPTTAQPPQLPTFDVVRIEADGASVIAGNAPAGAAVNILLNGAEVGKTTADANGKFVALLTLPTSTEAQVLSLSVQDAAGQLVSSQDQVIVAQATKPAIVAQANVETAKNSPDITAVTTADSAVDQSQEATEMAAETATENTTETVVAQLEEPQQSAPAVLLANAQGVRVLQPASSNPSVINNVAIDAISYDAQGDVQLSGRGLGDGFVRIYLDDTPVQTTRIDDNGGWQTALPNVDTGIYTLRVDQIDAAGDVTSRVQTPFKREAAQTLNEALKTAKTNGTAAPITAVTVQPGSTLWAIARDTYGDGALYVRVFEANSANIRNPDLIYPGQVFAVPK